MRELLQARARSQEELGGSLEITTRFPEGSVNIVNFGELGKKQAQES